VKPEKLKKALVGPIVSLPTFFTREGKQDLESVRSTVKFVINNDLKVLLLTMGDSNYALQSESEIRTLAKVVIEQANGRATVVVGTHWDWWRDQIIDFARYVENIGADGVMVLRPQPSLGNAPEFEDIVFETYHAVAKSVNCGIVLNGMFSMKLLRRLVEIPNIVALKEDAGDPWCHDALWTVGKKFLSSMVGKSGVFSMAYSWG